MAEVLLVNPANRLDQYGAGKEMVPLGLLSIAAILETKGYSVRILDLEFADADVGAVVEAERPSVVGIAGTSVTRFEAFEIAKAVKQVNQAIITVYGGSHASFTAQDTLEHVPEMDVVVRGEGEMTMLELMQCQAARSDLAKVDGLSYRQNGSVRHTPARARIQDLDALPRPARHLVDMSGYDLKLDLIGKRAASIITSRGCPVNCSFCSASVMFGKSVTRRSAKNVVDEIEQLLQHPRVEGLKIFDSTFTMVPGHAESICDEILHRGLLFPWECEIRVNTVSWPLLQKMKAAGCYLVDFGVESASERVLKRMHKGISLAQVEQVIQWTHDLGIAQKAFFTIGHIEETVEDATQTLEFIHRNLNRIALPSIGVGIRIYPGTEVEKYALANGLLSNFSWSEPYHEEKNVVLNSPANIPILIQPQLGFPELFTLKRRTLQAQSSSLGFILRRIQRAHSPADLRKYAQSAMKLLRLKLTRTRGAR
jgi:anaerobic magnesium-protoporphyrin IX monomethyl ester cyclase